MTSIHINTSEAQTTAPQLNGSLNQSQTAPSKYDEAERVKKKMDDWRRHHAESVETYNQSQPKLDEEIHDETIKYLKSTQINGTKTKSQKPRAPKRARTASNATNTASSSNNISANTISAIQQPNIVINHSQTLPSRQPGTVNHLPNPVHRHQSIPPMQHQQQQMPQQIQQQRHIQQQVSPQAQMIRQAGMTPLQPAATSYSPSNMQQPPMHVQHQPRPHQNQVNHQMYNGTYHSNQYQQQNINYSQQHQSQHQNQHQGQQQQQQQPPQQQHMQTISHNQHMQPAIDQSVHYNGHASYAQQNHGYYQAQPVVNNHQQNHVNLNQSSYIHQDSDPSLPNDLDLNVQAGLDRILFDWDTLIKMSAESQLDFNKDLLHKLDNPYHTNQ